MRQGEQGEVRGTGREYARQTEVRRANIQRKTECRERLARGGQGKKDREIERDGSAETKGRTEKCNGTEEGRRRDG